MHLYTRESDAYRQVNHVLRTQDTPGIEAWRPLIYHYWRALTALPPTTGVVFRGIPIKFDLSLYDVGRVVTWTAFSSTSAAFHVAQNFMGASGQQGIVFVIEGKSGREIKHYSFYPTEEEFLFPPNTRFKVERIFIPTNRALIAGDRPAITLEVALTLDSIGLLLTELGDDLMDGFNVTEELPPNPPPSLL
eukprot:NODE_4913_length_723_cov_15.199664_g4750_i0.p1 GENE.NODE_4913_length_723_cov_15.199664_g4750_i0~~NODE_4913_length_723_cov_15.199664_g4750_i0.p1  ORF type:complete len:214 (-),score=66.60 NODE_4913_length_723_cov_15.199664_g4750_i0:82-654(-)